MRVMDTLCLRPDIPFIWYPKQMLCPMSSCTYVYMYRIACVCVCVCERGACWGSGDMQYLLIGLPSVVFLGTIMCLTICN